MSVQILESLFSFRLKCVCGVEAQQKWHSAPGPSSSTSMLVSDLLPSTEYQFNVMAHNKLGSGPFSDITTARTMGQNQLLLPLLTISRPSLSLDPSVCFAFWFPPCHLHNLWQLFFLLPIQTHFLYHPSWSRPHCYPSTRALRVFTYGGRCHRLSNYLSTVLSSSHVLNRGSGRRWMGTSVWIRVKCLFRVYKRWDEMRWDAKISILILSSTDSIPHVKIVHVSGIAFKGKVRGEANFQTWNIKSKAVLGMKKHRDMSDMSEW